MFVIVHDIGTQYCTEQFWLSSCEYWKLLCCCVRFVSKIIVAGSLTWLERLKTYFDFFVVGTSANTSEDKLVWATKIGISSSSSFHHHANLLNRLQSVSTLQLNQLLVFTAVLTSQTLLPVSTGFELPSESSSNWRCDYLPSSSWNWASVSLW